MFLAHRFFLMPPRFTPLVFVPLFVCHWALATNPFTQYAVDFPDPNYVTVGQFGAKFGGAEATIVAWADEMASVIFDGGTTSARAAREARDGAWVQIGSLYYL
ncbi:hypothetical protein B0H13DRAFT_2662380 [Mycena leptocephala]|nr:hypothetical protein B0H13DRAFT_2662380 [Mycena leptocephala]